MHKTAQLPFTMLTTIISTGDTHNTSDQPDGEVNYPDANPPKPLPESPVSPTPEEVKEHGNEAFKSRNYTKAIDLYTQAIGEGHSHLFISYLDHSLDQIYLWAMNHYILQTEQLHIWLSSWNIFVCSCWTTEFVGSKCNTVRIVDNAAAKDPSAVWHRARRINVFVDGDSICSEAAR